MIASYRDLRVWQKTMELVVGIYQNTQRFPREEMYGLIAQMRRAAVSVPSNIAEGKGRSTDRDRNLFFCHARGSLLELETQLLIATELGYLSSANSEKVMSLCGEAGRMLNALISSLKAPEQVA